MLARYFDDLSNFLELLTRQFVDLFSLVSLKRSSNKLQLWTDQNQSAVALFPLLILINFILTRYIFNMPSSQTISFQKIKSSIISWTFIAGSVTLANPLDLIRFRVQVMPQLMEQGFVKEKYKSLLDCSKRIKKQEGIKAFWKGNLSNILRILPSETLIFWIKEMFQKTFHYHHKYSAQQNFYINSAIGISAALIVSFTLYPLQYVRQQLSNRVDNSGVGIWHQFRKTIRKNGLRGVYKGAHIFLLGLLLFRGTYFGIYDSLKVKTDDTFVRWWIAYCAMFMGITVAYPGDTVRRRIISSKGKYNGMINCYRSIWKAEGIRGIFLGWRMTWLQSFTGSTLYYFYDKLFTDYSEAKDN